MVSLKVKERKITFNFFNPSKNETVTLPEAVTPAVDNTISADGNVQKDYRSNLIRMGDYVSHTDKYGVGSLSNPLRILKPVEARVLESSWNDPLSPGYGVALAQYPKKPWYHFFSRDTEGVPNNSNPRIAASAGNTSSEKEKDTNKTLNSNEKKPSHLENGQAKKSNAKWNLRKILNISCLLSPIVFFVTSLLANLPHFSKNINAQGMLSNQKTTDVGITIPKNHALDNNASDNNPNAKDIIPLTIPDRMMVYRKYSTADSTIYVGKLPATVWNATIDRFVLTCPLPKSPKPLITVSQESGPIQSLYVVFPNRDTTVYTTDNHDLLAPSKSRFDVFPALADTTLATEAITSGHFRTTTLEITGAYNDNGETRYPNKLLHPFLDLLNHRNDAPPSKTVTPEQVDLEQAAQRLATTCGSGKKASNSSSATLDSARPIRLVFATGSTQLKNQAVDHPKLVQ